MGIGDVLTMVEISNWYSIQSESKDAVVIPRKEKYAVFTYKY